MEFLNKAILIVLSASCFTFCGSNHQIQIDFPQEMVQVYYETSVADSLRSSVSIDFLLEFKEELSEEIRLQKLYFRNQETMIEKLSDKKYVAHFPHMVVKQDFILDSDVKKEYGNNALIIIKPKFELNRDEAVLEYRQNNETNFFKLAGIKQKQ
jgi:hypothetical protein